MGHTHAPSEPTTDEREPAARVAYEQPAIAELTPATVLRLQRDAGNAAVNALLRREAAPPSPASMRTTSEQAARREVAPHAAAPKRALQRGFWGKLWGGIKTAASAVGHGVATAAKAVGHGVATAAKAVGSGVATAAKAVGHAVAVGAEKTWEGIKWAGGYAWEKLSLLGTLAFDFVTKLPQRFARLAIDSWEAIKGTIGWLFTGMRAILGHAWDAVTGTFHWLKDGFSGALKWLGDGLARGASWAVDFIKEPSLDKLKDALLGSLSWLWDGIKSLGRWGWDGVAGAAIWALEGIKGFGKWLWDGALRAWRPALEMLMHLIELLGVPEALQLIWGLIFRMRPLSETERMASEEVHGPGLIPYSRVRVDENSWVIKIGVFFADLFKTKTKPLAVTTMHVIHAPTTLDTDVAVHELTHVAQYEKVGAMYMPQALHAQGTIDNYDYGDLTAAKAAGKHYEDFNREQQASIAEDYYKALHESAADKKARAEGKLPGLKATLAELQPFIDEMRAGKF